ncbi:hypothetical protein JCM10212_003540 [Sporobolomyces blumeae]
MPAEDDFALMTSLAYHPDLVPRFPLLPRHLARLRTAHRTLAEQLPQCWCSRTTLYEDHDLVGELERAVAGAAERDGPKDLRVRMTILPTGRPRVETFPLQSMPHYPVKLVFDDRPTTYNDPFLTSKTTHRVKYDDARARRGATLSPSDEPDAAPFDVILWNPRGEITETSISNVAFRFGGDASAEYVTPRRECGLLEGVQRAELLERGEIDEGVVTVEEVKRAAADGSLEVICFNGVRGVFKAFVCLDPA